MNTLQKQALRHAANQTGFDHEIAFEDKTWLHFVNTSNGKQVWLSINEENLCIAAIEHRSTFEKLMPKYSPAFCTTKPAAAHDCLCAKTTQALTQLLWTIAEDEPELVCTDARERETEREVLAKMRKKQEEFRHKLIDYWHGSCAITGISLEPMLIASHIKPWADASDKERLDVYNGFLLCANLDRAFDQGFITFDDEGKIVYSPQLDEANAARLGIHRDMRIALDKRHLPYLHYHRAYIFKG